MKPTKNKKKSDDTPDLSKGEISEKIGGTIGETIDEDEPGPSTVEGDEGGGGSYGRPREQGDDDQPA